MNPLETSYRRLLHAYPVEWREERGEEMLAVLLESAPDHQTRPSVADALNLVANGLRTRIASVIGWIPREVMERTGIVSLGSGAALSAYCLLFGEYVVPEARSQAILNLGPVYSAGSLLYVLWLAATLLVVTGVVLNLRRVATVLLSLTASMAAVHVVNPDLITMPPLYLLALFAGLSAFAIGAPRAATPPDRVALGLVATALGWGISAMSAGDPLSGGGGDGFYRGTVPNLADGSWLIVLAHWLAGAFAARFSRGWLRAAIVASVPWACFSLMPTSSRYPDLVIGLVGGAGLLAVLAGAMRLDRHRDTKEPRRTT
jgi:hypothetical protein